MQCSTLPSAFLPTLYVATLVILTAVSTVARRPAPSRRPVPDEQRLLNRVFRNYDNSVRPVYNATSNVVVEFGVTLIQIMDMDEKNQVLVTNVWLEHGWVDERIKWVPEDYNNLHVLRIPASKLWLPDIVLYNNADDFTVGYMPSNAMVHHDGTIFWSPPARLRSSCKVDITYFPFDQQNCTLKFGSWTYDQAQVDIVKSRLLVDMSNYITNGEWSLVRTAVVRNEVVYPISDAVYPDVTVQIVIYRRILYYILNIIFPCVWLNMLSLLSFCLPPDAGEKITLGITVLLSYSVFTLLIAENMPPTSEFVPLIGIYLTLSMALTSISVILTVWVLKLHHCGPNEKEVPNCVRYLVLNLMARFVRCRCTSGNDGGSKRIRKQRKGRRAKGGINGENSDVCLRLVNEVQLNKHSPVADFRAVNARMTQQPPDIGMADLSHHNGTSYTGHHTANHVTNQSQGGTTASGAPPCDDIRTEVTRFTVMEEILKYLKIMVAKRDDDDVDNTIVNEWRQVAQVFDRFLFWFFLITTGTATLAMIVIIPLTHEYD